MKRERDSQKSRLYKAEKVLEQFSYRLETVPEMAAFLTKVMNRAPIQRRYGPFLRSTIEVQDGRRCRSALGDNNWIKMPRWSRTAYIVLHEAAHSMTHRKHGRHVAGHGREYAAIYLDLIHFGLGKEAADALKASFKENRVRYRPKQGRAKPVFTKRVEFKAAAKVKPPKPKTAPNYYEKACAKAYREFRKMAGEFGFKYEIERETDRLAWIEIDKFPATGQRFTTMHYDWEETLRRVKACIEDPLLLDEGGGYSE